MPLSITATTTSCGPGFIAAVFMDEGAMAVEGFKEPRCHGNSSAPTVNDVNTKPIAMRHSRVRRDDVSTEINLI
jgi:hypothetical protein